MSAWKVPQWLDNAIGGVLLVLVLIAGLVHLLLTLLVPFGIWALLVVGLYSAIKWLLFA